MKAENMINQNFKRKTFYEQKSLADKNLRSLRSKYYCGCNKITTRDKIHIYTTQIRGADLGKEIFRPPAWRQRRINMSMLLFINAVC